MTQRTSNLRDDFDKRLTMLDKDYKKLDEYVHRDTNFTQLIEESCEKLADRMKKELGKIQTKVFTHISQQEALAVEQKFSIDRVDRMYRRIKDDVIRHETLSYEIATKFEQHHDVMI